MIPAGYMAKRIVARPDWLKVERVTDIFSVSNCMSDDFADYSGYWKHNAFWFFDSPDVIRDLAKQISVDLTDTRLFYYEVHELEYDEVERVWKPFGLGTSFKNENVQPDKRILEGYDVVSFYVRASPECSPLSCNSLASEIETNEHCLLSTFEDARRLLEEGRFNHGESGPYRIFAVYSVPWG